MNDPKQLLQRYEPKEIKALATKQQLGALRFSPCGKFLVGGGYDGLVHRWDMSAADLPELLPLEGHAGWVEGTDPPASATDARRRYYRLTRDGREALRGEVDRLGSVLAVARERRIQPRGVRG